MPSFSTRSSQKSKFKNSKEFVCFREWFHKKSPTLAISPSLSTTGVAVCSSAWNDMTWADHELGLVRLSFWSSDQFENKEIHTADTIPVLRVVISISSWPPLAVRFSYKNSWASIFRASQKLFNSEMRLTLIVLLVAMMLFGKDNSIFHFLAFFSKKKKNIPSAPDAERHDSDHYSVKWSHVFFTFPRRPL